MGVNETLLRGTPGDARRPCPVADKAAVAYVKHYDGAIRWCMQSYSIPFEDRSSVHQEVSLRVLLRFRRNGPVPITTTSWIVTITRNRCADYWRKRRTKRTVAASDSIELHADTSQPADVWLDRQDAHKRLHLAVATLPPMSREIMRRVLLGHTLMEVAHYFDITLACAKIAAHRARKLLRARLVR